MLGIAFFQPAPRASGGPLFALLFLLSLVNLPVVPKVTHLALCGPAHMLEDSGAYTIYLGDKFQAIPGFIKATTFYAFLSQMDIGLVELSPGLLGDIHDKYWSREKMEIFSRPRWFLILLGDAWCAALD